MLAPNSNYGYAPSPANAMAYEQQHMQSGERPKLYMQPGDYSQMVPPHAMAPQQAMGGPKYETEPLLMNVQGGAHYYASPPMLHVSSDYEYAGALTPSSARSNSSKRSREDLNLKEKKRMFKLNDRINQLKEMLDEAGVQTKKNKQSILDNAAHYIEMLRSNLLIAKQKAERAEKQAEAFRTQANKSTSAVNDRLVRGVFQKTSTPRVVLDMNMNTVTFNAAFVKYTGQSEPVLKKQKTLRPYICTDQDKLDSIMNKIRVTKQSTSALVNTKGNSAAANLVAAVVTDDNGNVTNVEFSLIPLESDTESIQEVRHVHDDAETSAEESMTDGDVAELRDETSIL